MWCVCWATAIIVAHGTIIYFRGRRTRLAHTHTHMHSESEREWASEREGERNTNWKCLQAARNLTVYSRKPKNKIKSQWPLCEVHHTVLPNEVVVDFNTASVRIVDIIYNIKLWILNINTIHQSVALRLWPSTQFSRWGPHAEFNRGQSTGAVNDPVDHQSRRPQSGAKSALRSVSVTT